MLREINFKVFKKLLRKKKLKSITIDIDSSVVNVEGHQEGAVKGYNPKKLGNNCYNIQFAFCDEIKAFITGMVRSGDTYTANCAAELIKEIMGYLNDEGLEITFRMDSGYFDDKILETIESFGCTYVIKGKEYPTLVAQVSDPSVVFITGEEGRETTEFTTALNIWDKARRFVLSRVLKDEKDRKQMSFLKGEEYDYFLLSPINRNCCQKKWFYFTKNAAMLKITSRKPSMIWLLDTSYSNPFGPTKPFFSL